MASRSRAEICEILDENGPDLLERIQLSEKFYKYLISEKVVQDNTLMTDLKVMKPTEQTTWILGHVRCGNAERYSGFIRTLIWTGQKHVVKEILKEAPADYTVAPSNLNEKETCKFEKLKRHYQNSLGISPVYEYATRSRIFQIRDVFTKLHLIDNENGAPTHTIGPFMKEREHPSISLSEMFKAEDNALSVILEGKAGSGKTTLLKHCSITWANDKLISPKENHDIDKSENFPLFEKDLLLFVNKMHEGKDLDETIRNAVKGPVFEKKEAVTLVRDHPNKCFLFIDALDEFRNEKVREEIFDLTTDGCTNILVSCREGHPYLNDKIANFSRHVKVAGFKPADACNFIQKFMKSLMPKNEELCKENAEKICLYLKKEKVRNLYVSPINCAFVCIAFLEGHVTEKDLDTLTIAALFEAQDNMILRRECHKQAGSSEHVEQYLTDAMPTVERIYQLALHSLTLADQKSHFSGKQLEELDIDLRSPAMVLLVKDIYVSSQGEEEVYSWPHEKIKEFHAAKAVTKNIDINTIYYIASRPELNEITHFLVSMLVESNLELTKELLKAMMILQSDEPPCASSRIKRIMRHCCTKIPKLKKELQKQGIGDLLALGDKIPSKLRNPINMTKIQKCTRNTDWALKNEKTWDEVTSYISECAAQTALAESALHPFLPSVLMGSSAFKTLAAAVTEEEEEEVVLDDKKDLKLYMYPVHDDHEYMMIAMHFRLENSDTGDGEEAGADGVGDIEGDSGEEDEEWVKDIKGFCLLLIADQTIQLDDFTMSHLQHLARRVKQVDYLLLSLQDNNDNDDSDGGIDITWERASVTALQNVVKPKFGLILGDIMVRLFKDEDLHQLKQDGIRFKDLKKKI